MTAARPTPPVPKTASGRPAGRCTAFSTAPTPVITAHAEMAAISGGTPSGTGSTLVSETTTRSAKQETPIRWWMRLIALMQAGRAVHQPVGRREHPAEAAEHRVAGHARLALAAAGPPEQRHPVADRHAVTGPRTDRFDDAGALMADDERELRLQVARHVVQVAVADAGGLDADQDLPGSRLVELDVLQP